MKQNIVTLDKQGHMVIPLTSKEYHIKKSLLGFDLTQRDFEDYDGKWDKFFKKLNKNKLDYHDVHNLWFYLPRVIFMKVKKDLGFYYEEGDMLKICGVMVYPKSKVFKETMISVMVDHLRRKRSLAERILEWIFASYEKDI